MLRIAAAAALCLMPGVAFAQAPPATPAIATLGEATVKRVPDRALLTLATEARDAKAAEARRLGAAAMTAVQTALKGTGLSADAIRTTGYSLQAETDYVNGRSVFRDYVARNQIEVRVDDLSLLPDVIDAANTPKNVTLSIDGPRFDLKDRDGAEREALRLAVENALARAQVIAAGARQTLGPILRIENQTVSQQPPVPRPLMALRAEQVPSTPISPGEVEVRAQVMLTIGIR